MSICCNIQVTNFEFQDEFRGKVIMVAVRLRQYKSTVVRINIQHHDSYEDDVFGKVFLKVLETPERGGVL